MIVQSMLYFQYGIVTDLEAHKYISQAHNLIDHGNVDSPNFWLYSSQIFLIATALKLKAGFFSVYLFQLFFNALATYQLYSLISRISNRQTSMILSLAFIFNIPMQTFNCYLQTESLFYSLTILFSCFLVNINQLNLKTLTLFFLFAILICFTRPTGILFVGCAFLYLFFRFARFLSGFAKVGISALASVVFLLLLNMSLGSGGELDFMLPFRDERIICGVPTLNHFASIRTSSNPNSIHGLLYYITHNFDQFFRLAWLKSKAFWALSRPYYSTLHNLCLYLYFFPLYLLVCLSIPAWFKKNKYLLLYGSSLFAITWLTVILTCDDWHNRFFLSVVPYIYILAVPKLQQLLYKFNRNDINRDTLPPSI